MRLLGFIVAGCIGLALLRAAVVAGVILWGLLLLYALIRHPRELVGFLVIMLTLGLIEKQPTLMLSFVAICSIAGLILSRRNGRPQ